MSYERPSSSRSTMSPGASQRPRGHTNNTHADQLSDSLNRLTIASRTPLPPSSPLRSPRPLEFRNVSSPRPSPSPLRRSSSSMSTDRRSSSPALLTRRSSSNLFGHAPSPLATAMEEPPAPTANTVASDHFKEELKNHGREGSRANTVVILHDSCYGHRWSRPKTTKGTLSMIVERPERIQASVMGISAAYVYLGERHADGSNAPDPKRRPPEHMPCK
jgi:histone deacetylase HOS3